MAINDQNAICSCLWLVFGSASNKVCLFKYLLILELANILVYMVIAMMSRLLCMVPHYIGMLQFQKIHKQTHFVGCRAKTGQKYEKKHFGHLWPFEGCPSYLMVIAMISRFLCLVPQYIGMLQYQKILNGHNF